MKAIFLCLALVLSTVVVAQQEHERWDVKTLTDGFSPAMNAPAKITVAAIEPKVKIPVRNTQPRLNFEKRLVKITGTIKRKSLETDGDYHIEISDGTLGDSTFVCESVDPNNSIAATSPYVANFKNVRNVLNTKNVGDRVTFTGLLFQDKFHSPSKNRTRNFVEMHPILMAK